VDVANIIRVQRAAAKSSPVVDLPDDSARLAAAIVSTALQAEAKSESEFLEAADRLLALDIPRTPLSAEVPKRGRPAKATA
jgi:hypothetical protein